MRAFIDVALPRTRRSAITAANPVRCYADGVQTGPNECPQSLPPRRTINGGLRPLSIDSAHANLWPIPQGHNWEFQIPVRSSTTLTNSTLQANVWVLDGNSSPWLRPQQGVYVFSNTPTIIYPSPVDHRRSARRRPTRWRISMPTAHGGTGWFDLGTTHELRVDHRIGRHPRRAVVLAGMG